MYFVHPNDPERYALRILLLYRKGLCSFEQLRTVNGITYLTFKEACYSLGLLNNDHEYKSCLEEAVSFASAIQIKDLFVLILLNCCPTNPRILWDIYKNAMSEDYLFNYRQITNNPNFDYNDDIYNKTLIYK